MLLLLLPLRARAPEQRPVVCGGGDHTDYIMCDIKRYKERLLHKPMKCQEVHPDWRIQEISTYIGVALQVCVCVCVWWGGGHFSCHSSRSHASFE